MPLLGSISQASAVAVGAASTAVLVGLAIAGQHLVRTRIKKLIVRRDPSQVERSRLAGEIGAAVTSSVSCVSQQWVHDHGYESLADYFASLTVAAGLDGKMRTRWEKEALLSVASTLGLQGQANVVAGILLHAVPQSALPVVAPDSAVAAVEESAAMPQWSMASLARSVGRVVLRHKSDANPFDLLSAGEPAGVNKAPLWTPTDDGELPAVVVLPRDLLLAESAAFGGEHADVADTYPVSTKATPVSEDLLPGLCAGSGGLRALYTPRQEFYSRYTAALLNRLIANDRSSVLPAKHPVSAKAPFKVVVQRPGGGADREATTLQQFFDILQGEATEGQGAPAPIAQYQCQLTVFGQFLCVKDGDNDPVPVPFTLPLRTGVVNPETGRPIDVPATHASVGLEIQLPGASGSALCQYYLGVEGFCGFHPNSGPDAPWLKSKHPQLLGPKLTAEELRHACPTMSALALTFAEVASQQNLPCGGYGELGICNDSVAMLQLAERGETQVANTGGTGVARQRLTVVATGMRQTALENGRSDLGVSLGKLAEAFERAPCDTLVEPSRTPDAARRLLYTNSRATHCPPLPNVERALAELKTTVNWWETKGPSPSQI